MIERPFLLAGAARRAAVPGRNRVSRVSGLLDHWNIPHSPASSQLEIRSGVLASNRVPGTPWGWVEISRKGERGRERKRKKLNGYVFREIDLVGIPSMRRAGSQRETRFGDPFKNSIRTFLYHCLPEMDPAASIFHQSLLYFSR